MKNFSFAKRRFLFLQGPPGPFFWLLAQELEQRGHPVFRINFNGGDRATGPSEAVNYRGSRTNWNRYIDRFIRDNKITDILLFGDCRPLHMAAHGMAKLRGINIHVFEEGYIRPHWVTMEPDGVNGYSTLTRDPAVLIDQAAICLRSLPLSRSAPASSGGCGMRCDIIWRTGSTAGATRIICRIATAIWLSRRWAGARNICGKPCMATATPRHWRGLGKCPISSFRCN
jgi:capsular polysaccharide export protein